MAYDETLADRIRETLILQPIVEEKKMMGGLCFMVNDKMCVGVLKDELMVRINPDNYEVALQKRGCHEMDFTGKVMRGFVLVSPEGMSSKADLEHWVNWALEYNPKAKSSKKSLKNN